MKEALKQVSSLVERFERNIEAYRSPAYNETQLRREFIDPFFEQILGMVCPSDTQDKSARFRDSDKALMMITLVLYSMLPTTLRSFSWLIDFKKESKK